MNASSKTARLRCVPLAAVGILCFIAGCEEPQPITFAEFMDDDIAREGTLARCNVNRTATGADIECANARRAAAALALRAERARREALERESERKLAELREQVARERAAAREAQLLAEAAARAAYDAQWSGRTAAPIGIDGQPIEDASGGTDAGAPGAASTVPLPPGQFSSGQASQTDGNADPAASAQSPDPAAAAAPQAVPLPQ